MVPICNILTDKKCYNESLELRPYKRIPGILVHTNEKNVYSCKNGSTIIYGHKLAVKIGAPNLEISYNEFEMPNNVTLHKIVNRFLDCHFKHIENGIDVVFNEFDMENFCAKLIGRVLLHVGQYEIYVADMIVHPTIEPIKKVIVHSIKKDTLEYIGIDPKEFVDDFLNTIQKPCVIFSTEEIDLLKLCPLGKVDFLIEKHFSETGRVIDLQKIVDIFSPIRKLTKEELLTYVVKKYL